MSLRYQKRVNLGKGLGLNVSQSGASTSYRTKFGSIGSRGFSLKTGIPGLSYRGSFGENALPAVLIYIGLMTGVLVVYNIVRLFFYLLAWVYGYIRFLIMSRRDAKNGRHNSSFGNNISTLGRTTSVLDEDKRNSE